MSAPESEPIAVGISLKQGETFAGRFIVQEFLGAGGMSSVYTADDTSLERKVALKLLGRELALDPVAVTRFRNEAKASSSLDHSNIVRTLAFGVTSDNEPYLVMEYAPGQTLAEVLQDHKRLDRDLFERIFFPVIDAMIYAHGQKIVHRDLKPSNLMVCGSLEAPQPKVLDFGIAKILGKDEGQDSGAVTITPVGSPLYMSPEQCVGGKIDERSDIYSLACVMYEALVGKAPFSGETPMETMYEHLHHSVPDFDEITGPILLPRRVGTAIVKALSKSPSDRPQSMAAFKEELSTALSEGTGTMLGMSKVPPRKSHTAAIVGVLVTMLLCSVIVWCSCRLALKGDPFAVNNTAKEKTALAPTSMLSRAYDHLYLANSQPEGSRREQERGKAEALLEQGIAQASANKNFTDKQAIFRALMALADLKWCMNKKEQSYQCYLDAYKLYAKTGSLGKIQRLDAKRTLADSYWKDGLKDKGFAAINEGIRDFESFGPDNEFVLAFSYGQLADMTPDEKEAYHVRLKAAALFDDAPGGITHAASLEAQQKLYIYEQTHGMVKEAAARLKKLEARVEQVVKTADRAADYGLVALGCQKTGQLKQARKYYAKALQIIDESGSTKHAEYRQNLVESLKKLPAD